MRRLPLLQQNHTRILVLALLVLLPLKPVSLAAGMLLLAWLPGACAIRAMRIGQQWDWTGRFVLSVAVSVVLVPVVLNPFWHLTNHGPVLLGISVALLSVAAFCLKPAGAESPPIQLRFFERTPTKWLAGAIVIVVLVATIGPYWPTELLGHTSPARIHDFVKHHAVLDSFARRPLPLGNVFYADGAAGPTYYYHFFYILPATLRAWSKASLELCFGLAAAISGLSLTGMVYMATKRLKGGGDAPAALAASFMTLIGALDVIPLVMDWLLGRKGIAIILDSWCDTIYRVHSFLNQMFWSPQNVQGVTVVMLGVTLLSYYGRWRGWLLWGPILGASLIGSSIWVTMGIMPAVAIWGAFEVLKLRHDRSAALKLLLGLVSVAGLMLLAASPSLYGYVETSARHGKSLTAQWPEHNWAVFGRWLGPGILANVLDQPMLLTFDFGGKVLFLLGVGVLAWRRAWKDDGLRLLWISSILALIGFVTVRSHFYYNDFGQKIMMLPMAFTAIMAACILDRGEARRSLLNPLGWQLDTEHITRHRHLLSGMVWLVLVIGLATGVYEAPVSALARHVEAWRVPADEQAAMRFIRHHLPPDAVVQGDWRDGERAKLAQTIRRQIGVMDDQDDVLVFRPADWERHQKALADVSRALQETDSSEEAYHLLRAHQITHVYVGDDELILWKHADNLHDRSHFKLIFESGHVQVYELVDPAQPDDANG